MIKFPHTYKNGDALIVIHEDGTRIIQGSGFEYPLNVDIRVSTACEFGMDPKTGKAICNFCHESAVTNGTECNYGVLFEQIKELPLGTELAIGCNKLTQGLESFLIKTAEYGFINNLTVNQGHLKREHRKLRELIDAKIIHGLGISYRPGFSFPDSELLQHPNTVLHVIAGIDDIEEVKKLPIKKILILGEKDFGFNSGRVDLSSKCHLNWYRRLHELFGLFNVVSFDNLALEQLNVKRFLSKEDYAVFNQGEYSLYINAVSGYYARSSRSHFQLNWNDVSIKHFFRKYCND